VVEVPVKFAKRFERTPKIIVGLCKIDAGDFLKPSINRLLVREKAYWAGQKSAIIRVRFSANVFGAVITPIIEFSLCLPAKTEVAHFRSTSWLLDSIGTSGSVGVPFPHVT
jgi:hypothetical protein